MSQERANIFTNAVANIAPQESVTISIEYQQTLHYEDGSFSLRFPMTLAPRYIPGAAKTSQFDGLGWARNTHQVLDAERISPPIMGVGVGADKDNQDHWVTISLQLNLGLDLENIKSAYHPIDINNPAQGQYHISLQKPAIANRDFVLRWQPVLGQQPRAAQITQTHNAQQYGLLMLMPPRQDTGLKQRLPRQLIFVIDTSGSMAGESIVQAKQALQWGIQQLHKNDSFNIVEFNSQARRLYPSPQKANRQNKRHALAAVDQLTADGATEIAKALTLALVNSADAMPPQIKTLRQVVLATRQPYSHLSSSAWAITVYLLSVLGHHPTVFLWLKPRKSARVVLPI